MKKPKQIKKDKTILLIDSNKIHSLLIDRIFKRSPYKIIFAGNKKEICNYLISDIHFDLVLIELYLCGTDGFALIKLMKKIKKDIPIIALTVCATTEERDKCFSYGCDAFITKPFRVKNLLQIIEQTLNLK